MPDQSIESFSINQAVNFCYIFRDPLLQDESGKFKQSHLKVLTQEERKICLCALTKIAKAELPSPVSLLHDNNSVIQSKMDEIGKKFFTIPTKITPKKIAWYRAPFFLAIAKAVHSLFLWFKNTFMNRLSSKSLLDKVVTYCQDSSLAPSEISDVQNVILPAIQKVKQEKIEHRDEIVLKNNLANGLLETYKVLLALKSEGKKRIHYPKSYFILSGRGYTRCIKQTFSRNRL